MPGRLEFDLSFSAAGGRPRLAGEDEVTRFVIVSDFGACERRADGRALVHRRVDIDTFDELVDAWRPAISPAANAEGPYTIEIRSLEDLHPDRLLALPVFEDLRRLRDAIEDPTQREAVAAQLTRQAADFGGTTEPPPGPAAGTEAETTGETLSRLLGDAGEGRERAPTPRAEAVEAMARRAVGDSAVPVKGVLQEELERAADAQITERLRSLLRDPGLRKVERSWRSLYWLLSRLEPAESFEFYAVDADLTALRTDGRQHGSDVESTGLYQALEEIAGEQPVGDFIDLIVLDQELDASVEDIDLLRHLAGLAAQAGVACAAGAHPGMVGAESLSALVEPREWRRDPAIEQAWEALRASRAAGRLGLVMPGFLLRLPYGRDTDPVERMEFEEIPAAPRPELLLWGTGPIAFALLFGRQRLGVVDARVEDVPAYVYAGDSGRELMPCNGVLFGERAALAIRAQGIMPLVWPRGTDCLQLEAWLSVAKERAPA